MFTGIVEHMGTVSTVSISDVGRRIVLAGEGLDDLGVGASLSVNGVCLTAVEVGDDSVSLDVVPETLSRTNLGALAEGDRVNLERPMPAHGRFDGHIVQGHVDGVGEIVAVQAGDDQGTTMTIRVPDSLSRYIVEKGSVTVDGVSLTVASLTQEGFEVALIPHTLAVTNLGLRRPGEAVNLETDVLAKYVERLLSHPE